ncbi:uncharacterized protein CANTADRAFT_101418 [Suhomyces tanzawaensis NRRL Y-17324]|uniref:SCA7 domain-containing protein n=1 Tax=Suhomyces tanzawaensis NRRL Y-17324 TaxID=984487 RepID=A0A1E4SGN7_9ASCO|nr:uncharacterized protein CANTADRAFT_101418 [Suhomyces tanzawaensis NRRL Y-17324]ODV78679.1 hypothetical protein CANTADRAFT_101418 [Suhomyces tanzawaensis NRRL Y-17324]
MSDPLYYENSSFLLCVKQFGNSMNLPDQVSSSFEQTLDDSLILAPILNDLPHKDVQSSKPPRLPGVQSIMELTDMLPPTPGGILNLFRGPYSHLYLPSSPLSSRATKAIDSGTISFPLYNLPKPANDFGTISFPLYNVHKPASETDTELSDKPGMGSKNNSNDCDNEGVPAETAPANGDQGDPNFAPKLTLQGFTEEELQDYELHHNDYLCGVSTFRSTACKRNLTCRSHPLEQKQLVPRSKPFDELIRQEIQQPREVARKRKLYKRIAIAKLELEKRNLVALKVAASNGCTNKELLKFNQECLEYGDNNYMEKDCDEFRAPQEQGSLYIRPVLLKSIGNNPNNMGVASSTTGTLIVQSSYTHLERYENFPETKYCPSSIFNEKASTSAGNSSQSNEFKMNPRIMNTDQIFKILQRITTKKLSQKELYIHSLSRTTGVNINETVAYLHYRLRDYDK